MNKHITLHQFLLTVRKKDPDRTTTSCIKIPMVDLFGIVPLPLWLAGHVHELSIVFYSAVSDAGAYIDPISFSLSSNYGDTPFVYIDEDALTDPAHDVINKVFSDLNVIRLNEREEFEMVTHGRFTPL
jgi:hypothetical protein